MFGNCKNQEGEKAMHSNNMQGFTLLNSDDHIGLLKKMKADPVNVRPDICHQVGTTLSQFHLELTCFAG